MVPRPSATGCRLRRRLTRQNGRQRPGPPRAPEASQPPPGSSVQVAPPAKAACRAPAGRPRVEEGEVGHHSPGIIDPGPAPMQPLLHLLPSSILTWSFRKLLGIRVSPHSLSPTSSGSTLCAIPPPPSRGQASLAATPPSAESPHPAAANPFRRTLTYTRNRILLASIHAGRGWGFNTILDSYWLNCSALCV